MKQVSTHNAATLQLCNSVTLILSLMIPGLLTLSPTWLNAQFSLQPSSVGSNAVGICGSTATFQVIGHNPTFSVTGFFPVGFTATQSFNSSTGVLTLSSVNITDF